MKERPILMSASMVRAILDGKKTQTRRVIKPRGDEVMDGALWRPDMYGDWHPIMDYCPYHNHMTLWVREAWRTHPQFDKLSAIQMEAACLDAGYSSPWAPIRYEADGKYRDWEVCDRATDGVGRLRPSIHMPRWASRITLEVTGVRAERLQDINESDVAAEGCEVGNEYWHSNFRTLWDSINAGQGYGWETNPYVWVVEFRRVKGKHN